VGSNPAALLIFMKASDRRKKLKQIRRFEKEIKEDLKVDIAHFIADYYMSQWADLEIACRELLLKTSGPGLLKMRRRDLIKYLEKVTEELHNMNDENHYVMFGKKTAWGGTENNSIPITKLNLKASLKHVQKLYLNV
jgi:hypothetical protein